MRWTFRISPAAVAAGLSILLVTTAAFTYTTYLRSPWFGKSPNCVETWINAGTVLWAKNWYREGPLNLGFTYLWSPLSIETPTIASRYIYSSYPPGAVLPIYLLAKVLGREPSIAKVMACGLFNQFTVALLLALLMFLFAKRFGASSFDALLLSIPPILLVMFLPAPTSQFQMAYFHTVVLLPFTAVILLEFLRDTSPDPRRRQCLSGVQAVFIFFGMLTDWLFAFLIACLYLKRLVRAQIAPFDLHNLKKTARLWFVNSIRFAIPAALALGLFGVQLYHFSRLADLTGRFEERAALHSSRFLSPSLDNFFWKWHMVRGYGYVGKYLVLASGAGILLLLIVVTLRRFRRSARSETLSNGISLMFLCLAPCLLQTYILRQDSAHFFHFFTAAKFTIPIAAIPFVLLPATLLACLNLSFATLSVSRIRSRISGDPPAATPKCTPCTLLPLLLLAGAAVYARTEFPDLHAQEVGFHGGRVDQKTARDSEQYRVFFPLPPEDPEVFGAFIAQNTAYEDIVFTQNSLLEVDTGPMRLAHTMKHIYVADSLLEMLKKLDPISGEYTVNYVVQQKALKTLPPDIRRLLDLAYDTRTAQDFLLYKIRKSDFVNLCQQLGIAIQ